MAYFGCLWKVKYITSKKNEVKGIRFAEQGSYTDLLRKSVRGALLTERVYRLLEIPTHDVVIEERFKVPFPESPGDFLIGASDLYDRTVATVYDLKMFSSADTGDERQVLTYAVVQQALGDIVKRTGFITPFLPSKIRTREITGIDMENH